MHSLSWSGLYSLTLRATALFVKCESCQALGLGSTHIVIPMNSPTGVMSNLGSHTDDPAQFLSLTMYLIIPNY